jgi:hypothetical protein
MYAEREPGSKREVLNPFSRVQMEEREWKESVCQRRKSLWMDLADRPLTRAVIASPILEQYLEG